MRSLPTMSHASRVMGSRARAEAMLNGAHFDDVINAGKDSMYRLRRLGDRVGHPLVRPVENAAMPSPTSDYTGQRPGLFELPPVSVVSLTGSEFGDGLRYLQLAKAADQHLRALQGGDGLLNSDTSWRLKINGKGRKKMGDNADQSIAEVRAVAGIEQLARVAVVADRHEDEHHHNPDVKSVLRLYAPLSLDGVLYRVRLTVKDYGDPRMLHALSAIEIENAPLGILPSYSSPDESGLQKAQPATGRTISVSDLLRGAQLNDGQPFKP